MAKGQNPLAVHGRNRARSAYGKVTIGNRHTHCRARFERCMVVGLIHIRCTRCAHGQELVTALRVNLALQKIQTCLIEAGKIHDILGFRIGICILFRIGSRLFFLALFLISSYRRPRPVEKFIPVDFLILGFSPFFLLFLLLGLSLFPRFRRFLDIYRGNMRLVLLVRHGPEGQHLVNRRNEEGIRRHILDTCCHGTDKIAIHIDRTAAHALQDAAGLLNHRAGSLGHNHGLGAFAVVHIAHDIHLEIPQLAAAVNHRVGRARHPFRYLTVGQYRVHSQPCSRRHSQHGRHS